MSHVKAKYIRYSIATKDVDFNSSFKDWITQEQTSKGLLYMVKINLQFSLSSI